MSTVSEKNDAIYTIAFYNVENLFDTQNDPDTADDDFTAKGKKHWNYKRYKEKVYKLTSVIAQLGTEKSNYAPAIVGLVEVENEKVVQDLVQHKNLLAHHYDYVHYDSPDERGIDVALLYNKQIFEFLDAETHSISLLDEEGEPDYTRDILRVTGRLKGELIHVLVNHWPSRREGVEISEPKRITAASVARNVANEIVKEDAEAKIIFMGDFNDDPSSKSVKEHLVLNDFYNPMESLLNVNKTGSLMFEGKWNLFDQIMFTKNLLTKEKGKLRFKHAAIFNKDWLKIYKGKLKGSPFRTYIGPWYQGGFSDHFPVYTYFTKES